MVADDMAALALVQEVALSGPLGCRTTPPAAVEAGAIGVTGLPTILLSRLSVEVGRLVATLGMPSEFKSTEPDPKIIECLSELLLLVGGAEIGIGVFIVCNEP